MALEAALPIGYCRAKSTSPAAKTHDNAAAATDRMHSPTPATQTETVRRAIDDAVPPRAAHHSNRAAGGSQRRSAGTGPAVVPLLINLARRPDRLARAEQGLVKAGLAPFEHIAAVDLHAMNDSQLLSSVVSSLAHPSSYAAMRVMQPKRYRGTLGTYLSHIKALAHALRRYPEALSYLVFEDDVNFHEASEWGSSRQAFARVKRWVANPPREIASPKTGQVPPGISDDCQRLEEHGPCVAWPTGWDVIRFDCSLDAGNGPLHESGVPFPPARSRTIMMKNASYRSFFPTNADGNASCVDGKNYQPASCWYAGGAHAVLYRAEAARRVLAHLERTPWGDFDILLSGLPPHLPSYCLELGLVEQGQIHGKRDSDRDPRP